LTAQQELAMIQREPQAREAEDLLQPEMIKISIKGAGLFGSEIGMVTHLYRPPGDGPFPVVVFPTVAATSNSAKVSGRRCSSATRIFGCVRASPLLRLFVPVTAKPVELIAKIQGILGATAHVAAIPTLRTLQK